jgi:hypothetical protein
MKKQGNYQKIPQNQKIQFRLEDIKVYKKE